MTLLPHIYFWLSTQTIHFYQEFRRFINCFINIFTSISHSICMHMHAHFRVLFTFGRVPEQPENLDWMVFISDRVSYSIRLDIFLTLTIFLVIFHTYRPHGWYRWHPWERHIIAHCGYVGVPTIRRFRHPLRYHIQIEMLLTKVHYNPAFDSSIHYFKLIIVSKWDLRHQ